jgi:hypothetical protein
MRFMRMVESAVTAGSPPGTLLETLARLGQRVRLAGGTPPVTDGPFIETKELIGGDAVYDSTRRPGMANRRFGRSCGRRRSVA